MGYTVVLIKTQTNQEPLDDIYEPIPFPPHKVLLMRIRERFPDGLTDDDPAWAYLCEMEEDEFNFRMELNIGELNQPIECIQLICPCGRDGPWAIRELCRMFDCRAWDDSAGEFMDFANPSGWLKDALDASDSARRTDR